MQSKIAKSELD